MESQPPKFRVLFPIFPGFNTLDLHGPVEVIGNSAIASDNIFSTTIASAMETTTAFENVGVNRNVSFAELLRQNASEARTKLSDFDIMVIPGGPPAHVQAAIDAGGDGLLDLIQAFAGQDSKSSGEKWLVSVCTGAGFLAVRGLLAGKTVTAHWAYLDHLREMCAQSAERCGESPSTNVVRKRWVDAGRLPSGTRLVTAGGVSCGIDCTLWMVSELGGLDVAKAVAMSMDYDWKFASIAFTEGHIIGVAKD